MGICGKLIQIIDITFITWIMVVDINFNVGLWNDLIIDFNVITGKKVLIITTFNNFRSVNSKFT